MSPCLPKPSTEPARQIPLYGEYEVAVLGGGPAGIAAAVAAARAGRRTLLIERYGFLGGMGTAAGVTNFCGLHANVHGEMHRVVQGIASDLLARIDRLDGLNAPHLILGKIFAQAYDTAAYKIAADDLLAAHKVDILFHALGAGVVMEDERRINVLMVETKAGRQSGARRHLHRLLGRRRSRGLGGRAVRSRRQCRRHDVSLDDVPPQRHRSRESGRCLAHDSGC